MPDGVHLGNAGLGSGTGKRVAPRLFFSPVPCVGVGPIETVAMIRAFNYRAMVNKSSKGPAVKREISPTGSMACAGPEFALRCSHDIGLESFDARIYHADQRRWRPVRLPARHSTPSC